MSAGLFVSDCGSASYAWLDVGCLLQNAGASIGGAASNAVAPLISQVETAFIIVAVAIIILVLILAFAPNVKHIVPHLSFL